MASGRSSRVKMRSRPIDVNRPLYITDTSQKVELDELEQMEAALNMQDNKAHQAHDSHHSGHTGQGDGMVALADGAAHIPTPPIFIDTEYHRRFDYGRFIQPSFYIKAHQTAGTGLLNHLDRYDLLREDIEWLAAYNASAEAKRPPGPTMTEDELEKMIDLFEKEAGKITVSGMRAEMMSPDEKIDPRKDFPVVRAIVLAATIIHVKSKIVEPVYDYWIDKRRRLGKALMRQYQEPPPRGNTDPHVAFRPRTEGRRISKRNPRKDDHSGYHKMLYLRRDFNKILDIIENVQTREQLKRESSLLNIHIFDAKLQATPWAQKILKEQPLVAQAIQAQQSIAPPPSSMQGAAAPPIPQVLSQAPIELLRWFRLLHSAQPPCTYSRAELEAEGRRRRQQNQAQRNQVAASSAHHGGVGGQKRHSSNLITLPRPRPDQGGGRSAEQRAREKAERHKSRREYALVLGSLPPLEDEPDELDLTDEEDLLSEDEEDIKFYQQIEAHVKRMKIERAEGSNSNGVISGEHDIAVKTEPYGAYASYASYPAALASPNVSSPPRTIPPGSKVGYVGGVVGRGNLIWLEAQYKFHPHHPHHQHHTHGHGHSTTPHMHPPHPHPSTSHATSTTSAAPTPSSAHTPMQISVVTPVHAQPQPTPSTSAPMQM